MLTSTVLQQLQSQNLLQLMGLIEDLVTIRLVTWIGASLRRKVEVAIIRGYTVMVVGGVDLGVWRRGVELRGGGVES